MRPAIKAIGKIALRSAEQQQFSVPLFLCPAILSAGVTIRRPLPAPRRCISSTSRRPEAHVQAAEAPSTSKHPPPVTRRPAAALLPLSCPGCGAPSQTVEPNEAGYYNLTRGAVKKFVEEKNNKDAGEDAAVHAALQNADPGTLKSLGLDRLGKTTEKDVTPKPAETPVCDRCHKLIHHAQGEPIFHPSIDSIKAIIEESPRKKNHIFHVIDAADFPMSVIPGLNDSLHLPRLRTQNRRSKSHKWVRGRIAEVDFIITRSDLLAPTKEQVNSLMPYIREVLRDALGRSGKNVRLGNVRLVSSKRGWWTPVLKKLIWDRGGACWMVGKVNVGKSNLIEVVFPKNKEEAAATKKKWVPGSMLPSGSNLTLDEAIERRKPAHDAFGISDAFLGEAPGMEALEAEAARAREAEEQEDGDGEDKLFQEEGSLLPPAQPETAFPVMPVVSSLPGTTASPIRIPFGGGKGEVIDLPGVQRSNLDEYVQEEHREELIMKKRVVPVQYNIKPRQSLLISDLIRITPKTDTDVFLAYPFVPLAHHLTATRKAILAQQGKTEVEEGDTDVIKMPGSETEIREIRVPNVPSVANEKARNSIKSAGVYQLKWDVTKSRAGPLTDKSVGKRKADDLPFVVYSADIVIEGVGWVELVCQVRRTRHNPASYSRGVNNPFEELPEASQFPEVEVFSPEGRFVAVRKPMGAYLMNKATENKTKSRPRVSMRSARLSDKVRRGLDRDGPAKTARSSYKGNPFA